MSATIASNANFRLAQSGDAAAVAKLLTELGYPCSREDALERIATTSKNSSQTLVVAEYQGDVCGLLSLDFMYFLPMGRLTCRITSLIVLSSHRHYGIGKALLREAEAVARKRGAVRLEVTSAEHRHEAHNFYKSCGYEESSLRFVKRFWDA